MSIALPLDDHALDQLFLEARTHNAWLDRPVDPDLLRRLWALARMGPTSANCSPARVVFVTTPQGKARLLPALSQGNRDKTASAPVTAIIGYDLEFARELPRLFPHAPDAASWFADPQVAQATAFRNGSLQAGYLILAARALGLDCGPMSGFDAAAVDAAFFAGTSIRSNMLCNLGYGDAKGLFGRSPRLEFDEACRIA